MTKLKCICGEIFDSFEEYAKHAKDCIEYQKHQDREARVKIENEVNLSK